MNQLVRSRINEKERQESLEHKMDSLLLAILHLAQAIRSKEIGQIGETLSQIECVKLYVDKGLRGIK